MVNPDQSISVLGDSAVGPYDGADDTLVGIVNNSSTAITAITVSGPGSGLAGFDGDGICTYAAGSANGSGFAGDSYCSSAQMAGTDPGDYAGPGTSFTLDPNSQDDVEVDFTGNGLAAGNSTYFSLEGALTAAVVKARNGGLSQRYVALGDSVPYGHGLANPYPGTQIGMSATAVQQGPSNKAYPALVATALHLTQNIRSGNCTLTEDDLAISGAAAASADTRSGNNQCTQWKNSESVQDDEWPAAHLAQDPATLVTIQAGADDIDFGDCMKWELTKFGPVHAQGIQCVQDNAALNYFGKCMKWNFTTGYPWHLLDPSCVRNTSVKPSMVFTSSSKDDIPAELGNIRTALATEIEEAAPYAKHIAVLNYYQPIPSPLDFKQASIFPGGGQVDPVCWGLSHNLKDAYNDAVIIQAALNNAIAGAVSDATSAGVKNVQLIDISGLEATHEMCTGNPALFSGELMPKSQFNNDLQVITECHVFNTKSCKTTEPYVEQDLADHVWRTAHPNAYGQQDIARAIESQLGNL